MTANADAMKLARAALRHWGVAVAPRLIRNRENIVFECVAPNGAGAALRLHRRGYQSAPAIRSELWWAEALATAGMLVPRPVPTLAGDLLVEMPGGRVVSMVSWIKGAPLGEGGVPLAMPEDRQEALHFALGEELARLHRSSDAATFPAGFVRPTLDGEALLGDSPAWGRFWENPSLDRDEANLLLTARDRLRELLADHSQDLADFGLIHADALRENVLVEGEAVRLIDFDDGVYGFRMYELGVVMSQNWDQPNRRALGRALLKGYAGIRSLPDNAGSLLEAFTLMRGLASCGWVIGRYRKGHPDTRAYAARAVAMAERWLDSTA